MTIIHGLNKESFNESEILSDKYLQLILLQYALNSIELKISAIRSSISEATLSRDAELKKSWVEEILVLEKVHRCLSIWSDALNKQCPNPGD